MTMNKIEIKIDRTTLPKDGEHIRFKDDKEEWHEGYFVEGDDIFHVTDDKWFFAWYVHEWESLAPLPQSVKDDAGEGKGFNEQTLRSEIAKVWGEYGAHMDVYDMLLKRAAPYNYPAPTKDEAVKELSDISQKWAKINKEFDAALDKAYPLQSTPSKQEAVEFAEWIDRDYTQVAEGDWRQYGTDQQFTTEQIFELFKQK